MYFIFPPNITMNIEPPLVGIHNRIFFTQFRLKLHNSDQRGLIYWYWYTNSQRFIFHKSNIRSIYSFNPLLKPLKFSSKVYWQPFSLEARLTLTLLSRWIFFVTCWTSDVVSCCFIASYDVWPTQVPNIDNSYAIIPVNSYLWIVQLLPLGACSQPPALFLLKKPFKHSSMIRKF